MERRMDRVGSPWRKKKNRGALLRGGTALAHKRSRLGLEGRDRRSNFIRIFFLFRLLRETSSELWVDSRGVWFVDTLSYEWSVIDAPSSPPPLLSPSSPREQVSTLRAPLLAGKSSKWGIDIIVCLSCGRNYVSTSSGILRWPCFL